MRAKFAGLLLGATMAVAVFGATSASAATEFGDNCVGDEITETIPITYFAFSAAGNSLSLTAPSAGVITKWKVNILPGAPSFRQTLKVLRQNGSNTVLIVGEATGTIAGGPSIFDTRIPVQAGDRLGLLGTDETFGPGEPIGNLFCDESGPENVLGGFLGGGGGPGSTVTFAQISAPARFPVSAIVEPDADNDGYGDETQDKCPQSAAAQVACPLVALSASATAKKGLATVLVTASSQAAVSVTGTVKTGKGKGNVVTLGGGTQVVLPGVISKFTLLFTQKLKAKLKQLTPKQSLTLKVTSTAPNVVGAPSVSSLNVKLKGQKKPKKGHKKPKS